MFPAAEEFFREYALGEAGRNGGTDNFQKRDPTKTEQEKPGHRLFDHNCAHCRGDDARGGEGPGLHGLTQGDKRVEKIIKDGIKGEMPAFGKNSATRR